MGDEDSLANLWDSRKAVEAAKASSVAKASEAAKPSSDPDVILEGPLRGLWDSRAKFDPNTLQALPYSARRYLEHAITPGTVLATSVKLRMHGEIKVKRWHKFEAYQLVENTHDFLWIAVMHLSGIPIRGSERFVQGKGGTQWSVFGLLPVMIGAGRNITRSIAGRAVAESIWLPSALCANNVRWTGLSERRAHAHIAIGGGHGELALKVDERGRLENFRLLRWGNPGGGDFHSVPFGGVVEEEGTFRGNTIPTRLRIGYYAGTDRFETEGELVRIVIDDAQFL